MKKLFVLCLVIMFSIMAMAADTQKIQLLDTVYGYSAPDSTTKTETMVPKDKIFEIVDTAGNWIKVEAVSGTDNVGKAGWVYKTGFADETTVGGEGVSVRSGPGSKHDRICSFRAGTKVKVIEKQIQWYLINFKDEMLYIWNKRAKVVK